MEEGQRLRGVVFKQRRVTRGLTQEDVAKLLRVPRKNIMAYELGVVLQIPRGAERRMASLNTKWTSEDTLQRRMDVRQ